MAVSEAATLDGSLQVSLINGFVPSDGDFFVVMTNQARSGSFASNNATMLGLNTLYNPNDLVLIAGNNAFPTVTLATVNGNTQTVCQPFNLQATAADEKQWGPMGSNGVASK